MSFTHKYAVDYARIPKERLSLAILLILLLMHETMTLEELILASGLSPKDTIQGLNNLQRLRLIDIKRIKDEIYYRLTHTDEALRYLQEAQIIKPRDK